MLTDEQKAAIQALKGADVQDVTDALKADLPDVHQAVFRVGFGTAKGEYETKLERAKAESAQVTADTEALRAEVESLRAKAPDLAKYEERLTKLKTERDEALRSAAERVRTLHKARFKADLKAALTAARIDPDYASEVLVQKYDPRIEALEDGTVKVLDEDGLTPLQAAPGELAKVFAERIAKTVDPKWITSGVDRGAGVTNGSGGGQGTGSAYYDRLRQEARARQGAEKAPSDKAAAKLGLIEAD